MWKYSGFWVGRFVSITFFLTFRFPSTNFEARIDSLNGCVCIIFVEIIFLPSFDNCDICSFVN